MGNVIKTIDTKDFQKIVDDINEYLEEESHQAEALASSSSFNMVYMAKKYDDWFLDPIVGFFIPGGIGDLISSLAILPAIYVAIFKLHSLRLTIAIISVSIIDLLAGLVPIVGDCIDAFYKSNKIACRLIVGYVEEDEDTMNEINKRATWGVILLAVIGFLIYACYTLILNAYHWLAGFLSQIF